ncbi:MAG: hypothetical protein PHW11_05635 [Anaerolineaceae bacterium]|nr:hypothetical protein [Anaerolineaceae bacterium]MDD4043452.1 hypothetical protein [Anaerolineaceae bacterium]MDD4578670.1 hypothetical protein [Anaerolineaceae bacterium]
MGYDVRYTKTYEAKPEQVVAACKKTAVALGGKVLSHDETGKLLKIQMDKKLQGKVLGDRSKLEISYSSPTEETTRVEVLAYPLDAIGQKLMFGARPGVVQTVLKVFFEQVEEKLKE